MSNGSRYLVIAMVVVVTFFALVQGDVPVHLAMVLTAALEALKK